MSTKHFITLIILTVIFAAPLAESSASAHELRGWLESEARLFPESPLHAEQREQSASLAMQPEYYHSWEDGPDFTFTPFFRIDSADTSRTHADIRELNFHFPGRQIELRAGVGKVFWGVTEFVHLIDIINQTDLIESINMEEKLGQPMLQLSSPTRFGTLELFVLPWFRERTFPGDNGRLRSAPPVDTDHPVYESGAAQIHTDFAFRWSRTINFADLGIGHFRGTGREPLLIPGFTPEGQPALVPYYEQIRQTSIDLQMALAEWLLKLEGYNRNCASGDYSAWTGGVEYTFFSVAGTTADTGLIAEYVHDSRNGLNASSFDNDVMFGLRLNMNDPAGTEVLLGLMFDLDETGHILSIEVGRRFGDSVRASLEGFMISGQNKDDPIYPLRQDDHLRFSLKYYF